MTLEFQLAEPKDCRTLTEIAFAAKRFWGYPEEWISLWQKELTIAPEYVRQHYVFKALDASGAIGGFCALEWSHDRNELEVAHLWVKPMFMRKGIGRALFDFALKNVTSLPLRRITVVADPNAQEFYEKLGFSVVGQVSSTPQGRSLPMMEMQVN